MADEQISLPSLILIVVIGGLVVRYLFFSSPSPASQQQPRDAASAARTREAAVERIQQMFPQLDRRTILWDLQRTGGSISATTERVLSGRIETPPVTFQPPSPPRTPANAASATTRSQQQKPAIPKSTEPDLITRYNLQSRINDSPASAENGGSVDAKGKAWSSNRDERQSALQRRRDEMIIAARRKMEAKIAAERAGAGSQ
ncbi:coupling of ubiquitin conjugation to ER degradation 1 [Apiospora aurea]|uniref:Coupling of ubiquitin conjugation to ER degradation 1 n=1 Tax=Apiospora aurea TaxID=335848 RepID=A0ABR1QHM9_9PEZI